MNNTNHPEWESRIEVLKNFGLNPNDLKVYNTLLNIGRTKTGKIIRESSVVSSRVYTSLQNLISKGLVTYQVLNNVKSYQAELPNQLIEEIEVNTEKLRKLASDLKNSPIKHTERNETNTYEGLRGLKMAYKQHIDGLEKNEVVSIMAFIGKEYENSSDLRSFFTNTVDKMMISKKCRGRMITNKMINEIIKKDRIDSSIYNIKYLSSKYTLPYALNISKKEVMISVWNEIPIVFTIRNPIVITAFQKNFDFLWGQAR